MPHRRLIIQNVVVQILRLTSSSSTSDSSSSQSCLSWIWAVTAVFLYRRRSCGIELSLDHFAGVWADDRIFVQVVENPFCPFVGHRRLVPHSSLGIEDPFFESVVAYR